MRSSRDTQLIPRRERVRLETRDQISDLAMAQVAAGGLSALSINAVAREMGMSGPAVYRYYASRDALLGRLVADAFTSLAATFTAAAAAADPTCADARLRAIARAYRAWSLEHPREYVLLTARVHSPRGREEMLAATERAFDLIVDAVADIERRPDAAKPAWLRAFGVIVWQRLHGHMALELEELHRLMGVDPVAVYEAEIDAVVGEALQRWARERDEGETYAAATSDS